EFGKKFLHKVEAPYTSTGSNLQISSLEFGELLTAVADVSVQGYGCGGGCGGGGCGGRLCANSTSSNLLSNQMRINLKVFSFLIENRIGSNLNNSSTSSNLKSKKDARMYEVLDGFLLDGPLAGLPEAAYLQPCIKQLSVPIHHAGDTTTVGETSLSFALMYVHARAEGAKKHVAALRQLMMDIVSVPLSSQTWVGEASTSVAPLSVEDYDEEDTDEALGSVIAVPKFETCCF
ncbi:hypothetical protein Tco_1096092, partial [Tanacetum coccineum]